MEQRCENCQFWKVFAYWEYTDDDEDDSDYQKDVLDKDKTFHTGECLRYPPRGADKHDNRGSGSVQWHAGHKPFPFMDIGEWCGEWKKRKVDV